MWRLFSLLTYKRKMWMEIIQLSLCRWLCIQFTSHTQTLLSPSLSDLELLKPIISSYFLFRDFIVALVFLFLFPSLYKNKYMSVRIHGVIRQQTYAFLCSLQGLQIQTQPA